MERMLDVGCGDGSLGAYLRDVYPNISVDGVDISPAELTAAKAHLDVVVQADLDGDEALPDPIAQTAYDVIIISEVLEHLFYPERILQHIRNVCHPETDVIITVPNVLFWKNRYRLLRGRFEYTEKGLMDRGHIHFFSWESLRQLLAGEGFTIVEEAHNIPTRGTRWLGRRFPGLFAYQLIVKARSV